MSPELYLAGLSLTVTHPPSPAALEAGRAGLRRAARRAPLEVPANLVLDLGALVAGIDAGRAFPTWPLMGDGFLPPDPFALTPGLITMIPVRVEP